MTSSTNTELTGEYYPFTPLKASILDRELIEQDILSEAFNTIKTSETGNINDKEHNICVKPTSLCLNSSQIPKINKHSNTCDILADLDSTIAIRNEYDMERNTLIPISPIRSIKVSEADKITLECYKTASLPVTLIDKATELTPDSIITDEPSSSSDYLSATYVVSPVPVVSSGFSQLNIEEIPTKMDNIDSGLETAGMLESLSSHKDITLTDVSLTESTLHDMINDDNICQESASNNVNLMHAQTIISGASLNTCACGTCKGKNLNTREFINIDLSGASTKDEKQRQNEEIVILESSSLSSETGSWESIFPPKQPRKDMCNTYIGKGSVAAETSIISQSSQHWSPEELCPSLVKKSPFKSTSCFIDAASLADEGDEVLTIQSNTKNTVSSTRSVMVPNESEPCTLKRDMSPNEWSGSNDNEDSLEQAASIDPGSIQKDLSPELSNIAINITDASLCTNTFDTAVCVEQNDIKAMHNLTCSKSLKQSLPSFDNNCSTPHNSIMLISPPNLTMYDAEQSNESHSTISGIYDSSVDKTETVFYGIQSDSHLITEKSDNISTVQEAYKPEPEDVQEQPKASSKWIVDMSSSTKSDISKSSLKVSSEQKDKTVGVLKSASKSTTSAESYNTRSSVDSDSTEKSNHNFFIDLSTLADEPSDHNQIVQDRTVKKNMFSIYIEFDDDKSTTTKEMPAKLSSCLNSKKSTRTGSSSCSKSPKTPKTSNITCASSDTGTLFFEKLESLCDDPNLSIPEIVRTPLNLDRHAEHNLAITVLKEEPASFESSDLFVKLSDLDKPAPKVEKAQTVRVRRDNHERMSRSIPDNAWRESRPSINLRSSEMISSFHSENALSLNRLFPHLKGDFSRSMPGSLFSRGVRSPLRTLFVSSQSQTSDVSELSSVRSSSSRLLIG